MQKFPSLGEYNGQFVHPRVAVGGCPHPEHVPAFVAAGIRGIVDARSAMLRQHVIYIASLPPRIHWKLLGTWDGIYPNADWTDRDGRRESGTTTVCPTYLAFMVEQMMQVVRDHWPVLIHCGGGIGRSGHLAAVAVAAMENITVQDAIERMRVHRSVLADWNPARYPGTDAQDLVRLARSVLNQPAT